MQLFCPYCYFSNTLLIFFYIVALGPERRKSDSGVMLPTLRVSLIQDMRYLFLVFTCDGNFEMFIYGFHLNCSNASGYMYFLLTYSQENIFVISLFYFYTANIFPDITSKGKMQLRRVLKHP